MDALMNAEPTMSSREIADLVQSRHDKVKQSIDRLTARGVIVQPPLGEEHFEDAMGRPRKEEVYRIGKRDSYVIVAQLSPEFTARLVDRWQELESGAGPAVTAETLMANPMQLLALTQGYALRIVDLERDMSVMQKDVDALDRIANTDGTFGVREAAKALQMPERKFTEWLQRNGWCYRQKGTSTLLGYADKTKAGFITHKVATYPKPDGTEGVRESVRFTPSGLVRLAKSLNVVLDPSWKEAA